MRGQKANIHVLKEMLELCQIIDSEGYDVKDEPEMRVIPFGELFNVREIFFKNCKTVHFFFTFQIYNYISDKVVGILLRARKHKLVEFEGEMLFQRRDDDVPIFLIKPISEIRRETNEKVESIKRAGSPAPQATSVLLDKKAHGLGVPKGATPRSSVSRTPTPQSSKATSPARDVKKENVKHVNNTDVPKIQLSGDPHDIEVKENNELMAETKEQIQDNTKVETPQQVHSPENDSSKEEMPHQTQVPEVQTEKQEPTDVPEIQPETTTQQQQTEEPTSVETSTEDNKSDVNNNPATDLPVVVIEATAVYVRSNNNEDETPAA